MLSILLTLNLALTHEPPTIAFQAKKKPVQQGIDFMKILTKEKSAVEKVLGKASKSGTDETWGDWSDYSVKGTETFRVVYHTSQNKTILGAINISFNKGTTWQKAAETLGLKPAKLKSVPLDGIKEQYQLVGDPYKGWNVFYSGFNARYPGDTEPRQLINENGGLPMIQFEARSINDSLPD